MLNGHRHPMGSDYAVFVPHLLADNFWFRLNGQWSVPWFTPAFCGGMPNWGNPQAMPYSLPQWLLWFVDPVTSIQITFGVMAAAGAVGTWFLLRDGFGASGWAAAYGAVVFLFNGFYLSHLVVGHLPYNPVMLTPWVAWLCLRSTGSGWQRVAEITVGGALIAVTVQGGMLTLLFPVIAAWVAIGLVKVLRSGASREYWMRLAGAGVVGMALSASKLVATIALTRQFGRRFYPLTGFATAGDVVATAFRSLFLRPRAIDESGYVSSPVRLGMHEGDFGISPVPLVLIVVGLIYWIRGARDRRPADSRTLTLAALGVLCILPLALNWYVPAWMDVLKKIPVFSSASTLVRWFFVYVPLLVIGSAFALERLPKRWLWSAIAIAGCIAWSLTMDRSPYLEKTYNPLWVDNAWASVRSGEPIPTIERMDLHLFNGRPQTVVGADDVFTSGASQVFCLEPLFGYFHENFPWRPLHDGPAFDVMGDLLNVKNPACEIFPAENHCKPGDQFRVRDREMAETFLSWGPIPFERSRLQRVADVVNVVAVLVVTVGLLSAALLWARAQGRERAP